MTTFIAPRAKLFGHLDRLQEIRLTGNTSAPVNVEIDLSNRCDLQCAMCHFAYTHSRGPWANKADKPSGAISGGDLMDTDLAFSLLEQLHECGVKSVTWTGGGEPTLHPDFDVITGYATEQGLKQGIYTHGGHLERSEQRISFLREEFTWVYISLDECTPETYHAHKGVNRFDKVCENVRALAKADGDATIGLGFLLHENNYKDVHSMVRLGRELGVDYVQFRPTILYRQDAPGKLVDDAAWVPQAIGRLNAYKYDGFVVADVDRFADYQRWTGHGYETCYWSALQTVITPNGKVWRCTNKREHPEACLGDLTVDDFATIWQRSGGKCAVNEDCRIACRGHWSNQTLQHVMAEYPHGEFV